MILLIKQYYQIIYNNSYFQCSYKMYLLALPTQHDIHKRQFSFLNIGKDYSFAYQQFGHVLWEIYSNSYDLRTYNHGHFICKVVDVK